MKIAEPVLMQEKSNAGIKEIIELLESHNIEYYVHAGFALYLWGLDGELDDIDIRISPKQQGFLLKLEQLFPENFRLRLPINYSRGTYDNTCGILQAKTKFDFCGKMNFDCDIGYFQFPFSHNYSAMRHDGISINVSSLESLLLYYLIMRRKEKGKKDEQHIKEIISHKEFSEKKFLRLFKNHQIADKIMQLYSERKE